jgi:hypothetical protein
MPSPHVLRDTPVVMRTRPFHRSVAVVVLAVAVAAGACGSSSDDNSGGSSNPDADALQAQIASFDLIAGAPTRLLLGVTFGDARLVGFGTINVWLRPPDAPADTDVPVRTASFISVHGESPDPTPAQPAVVGSEHHGVYELEDVEFNEPGVWMAEIEADIAERGKQRATTPIPVGNEHGAIAVGDKAPASVNPTLANRGKLPITAVDSRGQGATVPDPELHETTIKAAIAKKRPMVVAVTTPVF